MESTRRAVFTNIGDEPIGFFVELEGWDYWLWPGETVEFHAHVWSEDAEFEYHFSRDGAQCVQIYPANDMGDIKAIQNGVELEGGHKRPPGWLPAE